MTKLDVIRFLLDEIYEENRLLVEYEKAEAEAKIKASEAKAKPGQDYGYWYYMNWNKRMPRKSVIKHNLLKIRQLALDVSKEA